MAEYVFILMLVTLMVITGLKFLGSGIEHAYQKTAESFDIIKKRGVSIDQFNKKVVDRGKRSGNG